MGTPELDEEIVRFFMQHVVALNQAWDQPGVGTRHQNAYTCFVLDVRENGSSSRRVTYS